MTLCNSLYCYFVSEDFPSYETLSITLPMLLQVVDCCYPLVTVGCIMSNLSLVVFLTLLFYWQAEANKSQGSFSGSCTVELHLFRRRHGYEYVVDIYLIFTYKKSFVYLYKWIKERRILFFILLHRESNFTHLDSKHSRNVTITLVQQLALLSC